MSAPSGEWDHFRQVQLETGWGRVLERFVDWCSPEPGWRVLDVGCGPGLLPALFTGAGCRAVGVDRDPAVFRPRPLHTQVAAAEALGLPFPAGQFELVTAVNLLFLLPDPGLALRKMARLLPPGGRVAVLNPSERMSLAAARALVERRRLQGPARASLLDWAGRAEAHARWNPAALGRLFASAGLRLERTDLLVGPGLARLASAVRLL